jgi:DNA polymerase III subunit delta'
VSRGRDEPPEEADRLPGAPHPREAATLFGQEAAEDAFLAAARSGRLPHAWLITGPRGVGKATLAWRLARFLLAGRSAEDGLDVPVGASVARQVAALSHPGLHLCRRPWDDKTERLKAEIPVDAVREMIGFFRLSAVDGGARVAVIDAAEEMNVSAANALLKLLEEPPAGGTLLLVSHRPARLLPTIRSRCRELRCRPLEPQPLAAALAAAGAPEARDPVALAELAAGSAGAAFRLLEEDGLALYDEITGLMATAPPIDRPRMIALAEATGRAGATRRDAIFELTQLALGRLARAAAGAALTPASEGERRSFGRLAGRLEQARLWAETAARVAARADHARAVNLDPAQVILDTFLSIDAAAGEAVLPAA